MGRFMYQFDCDACDGRDIQQSTEPVLKYINGASVQMCNDCIKKLDGDKVAIQEQKNKEEAEKKMQEAIAKGIAEGVALALAMERKAREEELAAPPVES